MNDIVGGAIMAILGFFLFLAGLFGVLLSSNGSGSQFLEFIPLLFIPAALLFYGVKVILRGLRKGDTVTSGDSKTVAVKKTGVAVLVAAVLVAIQIPINMWMIKQFNAQGTFSSYFVTPFAIFVYLFACSITIKKYYSGYSKQKTATVLLAVFITFNLVSWYFFS
jgi:hypothetical protein